MSTDHYCNSYDVDLKTLLNHLERYPQFLPFFGNRWKQQGSRVLFIAESHYLPEVSNGKSDSKTWYQSDATFLTKDDNEWTHTRGVVMAADRYALGGNHTFSKGHTIFYNMKSAIFDALQMTNKSQMLFQHFGYYNYFQRPAETLGKSINTSGEDYRIAYNTIKAIAETAKPTTLIFVSKMAYNSFNHWRKKEGDEIFTKIPVYHVPHPASAWWNKESKVYGNNGQKITGRAKFINIIKTLNLQIYPVEIL